jgi:ferredoxin
VSFQILIEDTGETYACAEGETLLKAMERLGRKGIPVGCRGGGCGVCKVQVTQGDCQRIIAHAGAAVKATSTRSEEDDLHESEASLFG